jgi:hypothetical protein
MIRSDHNLVKSCSLSYRKRRDSTAVTAIQRPDDALTETAALKAGDWLGEEAVAVVGTELGCMLLFMVEEVPTVATGVLTRGVLVKPAGRLLLGIAEAELPGMTELEPWGTTTLVAEPAGTVLLVATEEGAMGLVIVIVETVL